MSRELSDVQAKLMELQAEGHSGDEPHCVGCERYNELSRIERELIAKQLDSDPVAHPSHYTSGPVCPHCGKTIECITITQQFNFNRGNAIKYIWRAGVKDPAKEAEDLRKAIQYLEFEIARLGFRSDQA